MRATRHRVAYYARVSWVLRGLLLLAATVPVFARTMFHPAWWQIFVAAAIGSALGQLAVRYARGRARWAVIVVAIAVIGVSAGWLFRHGPSHEATLPHGFLAISGKSLTWEDLRTIAELPSVERAVPYLHTGETLVNEDHNWTSAIVGTTPDYFAFMDLRLAAGQMFDATPFKAVVVGETVVKQMFGSQDPVGATVRIRNQPFEIVGVLAHRGMTAEGQDLDDVVLMSTDIYAQKIRGGLDKYVDGALLVSPRSVAELDRTEADVRSTLRIRHLLQDGAEDDFVIRRP